MKLSLVFILFSILFSISFKAIAGNLNSPDISANVLFLYRNSNLHKENTDTVNPDQQRNGLNLQESELQFFSEVDPYTRLNLLLSIHSQYEATGGQVEEKWMIEPEEVFAESNVIPDVTLQLGKFKAAMGKHNTLHTHAYSFIEAPLSNLKLLGDEGLNDVGVSASFLLPSSWFSELTLQYLRGEGENAEFNSPTPGDGVGLVHWKNLIDITDALTFELGASYAQGGNSFLATTSLTGADLSLKWRPLEGGRYQSFLWVAEYLSRTQSQPTQLGNPNELGYGLATWVQYQFAERWKILYRYDNLKVENTFDPINLPNDIWERNTGALVFMTSEFSSYKIEYSRRHGGTLSATSESTENTIFLQANYTIGAHPAHSY